MCIKLIIYDERTRTALQFLTVESCHYIGIFISRDLMPFSSGRRLGEISNLRGFTSDCCHDFSYVSVDGNSRRVVTRQERGTLKGTSCMQSTDGTELLQSLIQFRGFGRRPTSGAFLSFCKYFFYKGKSDSFNDRTDVYHTCPLSGPASKWNTSRRL